MADITSNPDARPPVPPTTGRTPTGQDPAPGGRTPEGILVPGRPDDASGGPGSGEPQDKAAERTVIHEPAKVVRIGEMVKRLLDEVRSAPLDEAARARLVEVHERSVAELEDGLSPDLVDELRRVSLPFTEDAVPTEAELRIAQAQLVGWLEGLFHGLQTAMVAQQMAAQAQLHQAGARALPPGLLKGAPDPRTTGTPDGRPTPGQYL